MRTSAAFTRQCRRARGGSPVLGHHIRRAGLRLIEEALEKSAEITTPTLGALKAKKTRELNGAPALPDANIPKVVSLPAT